MNRPHFIYTILIILFVMGVVGYFMLPQNMFPDAERPQISIVTLEPGASSSYIADHVSRPIEKVLYSVSQVRKVSSTSRDEVSVVTAEFEYSKGLEGAATDTANALSRATNSLPQDIKQPQIYKIGAYTPPVMIWALSPQKGSNLALADVRYLAANSIADQLVKVRAIANVDIFGGYEKEVVVEINKDKLSSYDLNIADVIVALQKNNRDIPLGLVISNHKQNIFKLQIEASQIEGLNNIQINKLVTMADISNVRYGTKERTAGYHGNGEPSIALAIQRPENGSVLAAIDAAEAELEKLKAQYPQINFQVTDSSRDLVEKSNEDMFASLRDAIIMISVVMFLFLANWRIMLVAALSIPFVYLGTISLMWLFGQEINMVTLTGIILALGMLVDDAVVILENIERHLHELKEDPLTAAVKGTQEVMLAVFAGTVSTMVVLAPLLFVGEYPQKIFRPLAGTLIIAIFISYLVSITFIPLIAPKLLSKSKGKNRLEFKVQNICDFFLNPLKSFYVKKLNLLLDKRRLRLILTVNLIVLLTVSVRVLIPLSGRDLMPPMDTGIVKVDVATDSNMDIKSVENLLFGIEKKIYDTGNVKMLSSSIGSEPGVFTVGNGNTQNITVTAHFIDRFHRKDNIWEIEQKIRKQLLQMPDIKYVNVYDYGATPLSTIKAPVDVMLAGSDLKNLDITGNMVLDQMKNTGGLTGVSRSWTNDSKEFYFNIDKAKTSLYDTTPGDVVLQLSQNIQGSVASVFSIPGESGLPVRVILARDFRKDVQDFSTFLVKTPKGFVPLNNLGSISQVYRPTMITRQGMDYTLDVYGYRAQAAVTHIMSGVDKGLSTISLPPGVSLSQAGDIKELQDSLIRIFAAILIALFLLYAVLVATFKSWKAPLAIMLAIPLSLIGGAWSLILTNKHMCLPAIMGFVLLSGIIVKNSILLIDFTEEALGQGTPLREALLKSVTLRTRAILMTAFATAVGMVPIAMEWAIGLERLSPLAVVAIGGLIFGTFLTLLFVPVFYGMMSHKKSDRPTLTHNT
ncbi:efflux RND transporter permease subunit [Desulfofarcimen acetoxidans]|nr:efflux RND transporter permease subunit [Desulfofarcimen acetoxidans]